MTKLLRIATIVACILMYGIVVGQIYMWEGRKMGRQEFEAQVDDIYTRLAQVERQLEDAEVDRIDYLVYNITTCESGRSNDVWGDAGLARGIAQYHRNTFYEHAKQAGLRNADWGNSDHQILLLKWAIWQGIAERHWTRCYRKAVGL